MANKQGSPPDSLARRAAKLGVTQKDVARHAGVHQPGLVGAFQRDQQRPLQPETRARYERAIEAAVAERKALAISVAAWLRVETAAGRLPKKPSADELRRVAAIVRSAIVAGANGASEKTNSPRGIGSSRRVKEVSGADRHNPKSR